MQNYFKVFTTMRNPETGDNGARRIDAHEVFPFDDASPGDTSAAFGKATDFASLQAHARVSVWRHPRCSKAWDDVRVIGEAPLFARERVNLQLYDKAEIVVEDKPLPPNPPGLDFWEEPKEP